MSCPSPRSDRITLIDLCVSGSMVLIATWWWHQFRLGGLVYGCLVGCALLWRRRHPAVVFAVVSLVSTGMATVEVRQSTPHEGMLLLAVATAMYAAVRHALTTRAAVLAGVAAVIVGTAIMSLRTSLFSLTPLDASDVVHDLPVTVVYGSGIWLAAWSLRTRRLHARERAVTARREREHLARIAVAEERTRIARELHDIVAHSLSVMILHANGAEYALDRDRERTRAALRTISATGQDALEEIKQLVQALRGQGGDPDVDDQSPAAALKQLDAVVDRARGAGLPVDLIVDGNPPPVPGSVALAVYRIVQEALTNTLKHAGSTPTATVRVGYRPDAIDVEVTDTGSGPPPGTPGGHGLVGMRERVSLYGGAFDAGPHLGGGWRVRARIPLAHSTGRAVAV